MADNFFRLVTFVFNICAEVLRNMFLDFAKTDQEHAPFKNLSSYLYYRISDIMALKRKKLLSPGQVNIILTSKDETDIQSWEFSMLKILIESLFCRYLSTKDRDSIRKIYHIRNALVHMPQFDKITDDQFNDYWHELQEATLILTSHFQEKKYKEEIREKIDHVKKDRTDESVDTVRVWFKETVTQLRVEFKQELESLRNDISSNKKKVDEDDDDNNDDKTHDENAACKRLTVVREKAFEVEDTMGEIICVPTFIPMMDEYYSKSQGITRAMTDSHLKDKETEMTTVASISEYIYTSIPMTNSWQNVKTVEDAQAVINDGLLPNERELSDVVQRLGRTSDTVGLLCKSICKKIETLSQNYIHVFAAYALSNKNKLYFVVLFENESKPYLRLDQEIVFRKCKGDGETEKNEVESELSAEESTSLKNAVQSISKKYMENHKYLSAITARKISFEERETLCIVLYVHPCTNRYLNIPHNEDHLPATIEGYKVVVRNGVYKTAIKTASEKHENVRMGCQITSNLTNGVGTLGGFIEHPAYGLCGFTCAHVVFGSKEMENVKKIKRQKRSPTENPCFVYQPSTDSNPIGRVVEAFYTEGGDSESAGVDLALFQIEERPPITGTFPLCNTNEKLKYTSGKTWGKSRLNPGCDVNKFGAVTGVTHGKVRFDGMSVKELNFVAKVIENVDTILYNQYDIEHDTVNVCEQGDSGALVFVKDSFGELICIGMVNGVLDGVNPLHGVVTPITDLLQEMKAMNLKPFRKQLTLDLLEKKLEENAKETREQLQTAKSELLSEIRGEFKKIFPNAYDN